MAWPAFLPNAWEIGDEPVKVGSVVTVSLGERRERYVITEIHSDGTADLTKETT